MDMGWEGDLVHRILDSEEAYNLPELRTAIAAHRAAIRRMTKLIAHAKEAKQKPWHICKDARPRRRQICSLCGIAGYLSHNASWFRDRRHGGDGYVARETAVQEACSDLTRGIQEARERIRTLVHLTACS